MQEAEHRELNGAAMLTIQSLNLLCCLGGMVARMADTAAFAFESDMGTAGNDEREARE